MISTGMSTLEEIRSAVEAVGATGKGGQPHLLIAHSTSTYPCPLEELNLRMIRILGTGV
jgi:N-acetylneuraminate synthase